MNITGIIAEYNPFHQGHAFHLKEARRLTGADYVIVAMSGNYVQRGVPAMFDKYIRAEAALLNGADLVLELPPCVATGSAEHFASGAVQLLSGTGVVTDLCFGSECGDLMMLMHPAQILSWEPEPYRQFLKKMLRLGKPYPEARTRALLQYDSSLSPELLHMPNNLLGIEYLKALLKYRLSIRPHTLCRTGAAYHETRLKDRTAASASGIREALMEHHGMFIPVIQEQLPSFGLYKDYDGRNPITENAFSLLLLERLQRDPEERLESYFGVTEELSNRIRNCLDAYTSFSQFTDLIKTRNLTRTSVSRALLHILLNLTESEPPCCLRVLGFRKDARSLLKIICDQGMLPLVTSPADERLPKNWLYGDRLYESVRSLLHHQPFQNECRRKMLVL